MANNTKTNVSETLNNNNNNVSETECPGKETNVKTELPRVDEYPKVAFDIDADITKGVLNSCIQQIEDDFYFARAHGVDLVIDKNTAYYNASQILSNEKDLETMMQSDVMKLIFDYIEKKIAKEPYYRVLNRDNKLLNGVYMHGMTIGNVLGNALY